MADTKIRLNQPAFAGSSSIYLKIENVAGQVYNGSAMVTYVLANLATYAKYMTESPSGSGRFEFNFLSLALPEDDYTWTACLRASGSVGNEAITDPQVGVPGGGHWSGTTFGAVGAVTSLPDPAPDGYGPIGTGSVGVDHDYPTDDNLRFQLQGGQGIGGAQVRAYLASEWATNPATATIRGQTLTLADGSWANVIDLDPGDWVVTFKHSSFQLYVKALTVS